MNRIQVGKQSFELQRSPRRKTLELAIEPDGRLRVLAPSDCTEETIRHFINRKQTWLHTKLAKREALPKPLPDRRYVNGESFPYLGRNYRLQLVARQDVPLKLDHGRFTLHRKHRRAAGRCFVDWYTQHAKQWLSASVARHRGRVGVNPSEVKVMDLKGRWGSCGKGGKLNFHWKTILLPTPLAEYIVVHELAHLREPHHTPEFWLRVERVLPDYERRKERLAVVGAELPMFNNRRGA